MLHDKCLPSSSALLVVLVTLANQNSAVAANWSTEKQLTLGMSRAINNSRLVESDGAVTVASLEPQFALIGQGSTTTVVALGQATYLNSGSDRDSTLTPRIYGAFDSGILGNNINLGGNIQMLRDSADASAEFADSQNPDLESNTTYTMNIGPRFELDLGNSIEFALNYEFKAFVTDEDEVSDSTTNALALQLQHDNTQRGYQLGFTASVERSEFTLTDTLAQQEVAITAGTQLGREWSLSGSLGTSRSEIPELSMVEPEVDNTITEKGNTWNIALGWNPQLRTSLVAGYGENEFGQLPSLRLRHQLRRSEVSLGWSRGLSRSQVRLTTFTPVEIFDSPEFSDVEESTISIVNEPVLEYIDNRISILEQIRAGYVLRGRLSRLTIDALHTEREFRFSSNRSTEKRMSVRSVLTRKFSNRTSLSFSYEHSQELQGLRNSENIYGLELTVKYL